MNITLSIVNKKRRLSFRIFLYTFSVSIVIFFSLLVFTNNRLIYLPFAIISFVTGVLVAFLREHFIDGNIILNENQIEVIFVHNKKETFSIISINKIIFDYQEFEGEPYNSLKSIGFKKGLNNYLTFYQDNSSKSFELLLKKTDLPRINQIIKFWQKNKNLNVVVNNKWKNLQGNHLLITK